MAMFTITSVCCERVYTIILLYKSMKTLREEYHF